MDWLTSLFSAFSGGGLNTALQLGGTAMSAYGAYEQGQAGASSARNNAGIASDNAILSEQQGNYAANLTYKRGERSVATATANFAANGVDVSSGSPMDVLADAQKNVLADTLMAAQPYAARTAGLGNDVALDKNKAQGALTSSYFQIGTDLSKGAMRMRGGSPFYGLSSSGDGD